MAWELDLGERSRVNRKHKYSGSRENPVYELSEEWESNPFRFHDFGDEK
jgi:hypothetical protein